MKEGEQQPAKVIGVATSDVERVLVDARTELLQAQRNWPTWHTAHEGYAVMLEELDELKAHVWKHPRTRDVEDMRREAIQVAAAALRFALEICDGERGRL